MQWLTWAFLGAVTAETLTRLWLGSRQIAAVQAHRNEIPEPFRGQVALEDQQKAADYTAARVRLGRYATLVEAVVKVALTLGGGLAAVDAVWRGTGLGEPWRGACVVASLLLLLQLVGLPFSLWRTFGIEARFGFNRMTPRLYAVDFAKQLLVTALLGGPLLLATLTLMERAGARWWLWVWSIWLVWTLALTWGYPKFIAPLFNRFSPLDDAALKQRLETLLERCGFAAAWRIRHGRIAALGAWQRVFYRHRTQQTHRVLRYPAVADRSAGNRSGAGPRARPFPPAPRATAAGGVGAADLRRLGACSPGWRANRTFTALWAPRCRPPPWRCCCSS